MSNLFHSPEHAVNAPERKCSDYIKDGYLKLKGNLDWNSSICGECVRIVARIVAA
jgi:hypothetical protein